MVRTERQLGTGCASLYESPPPVFQEYQNCHDTAAASADLSIPGIEVKLQV